MTHPNPNRPLHLGLSDADLDGKPYREFYQPQMKPLPEHVKDALLLGPIAAPLLPSLTDMPKLLAPGYHQLEDGYGFRSDGAFHVAVRTDLPGVSPEMIDWWFAWHSAEPQRYKLWHPRAHVHAQWDAPDTAELLALPYRQRYIGRTSFVDEYLGSEMSHIAVSFIAPSELGFDEQALRDPEQATVVCARISLAEHPVDAGFLLHHVRRVPGGSEMRSRFFIGGQFAFIRAGRFLSDIATRVARTVAAPRPDNARDLLVHCSQEMSHLASFLPQIYAACRNIP